MSSKGGASHLKKRVGKYLLGRTIGEGTYAKVKYGQHSESGEAVAIKVLDKEALVRSGMVEQIKREITILKQIRHPHIVNLLEVMSSKDKIFMVLELVTGGELFDKVVADGPMKEPTARRMFSQLLDAVGHCHKQGVFHRDLKPENVLLGSDGGVKLSDFGLGALPSHGGGDQLLRTTCGTPNYVAPEVLAKHGYHGGPADIWSLGVTLYVMLAGCLPFDEDDLAALFRAISAAKYEVPPWLSRDAVGILAAMLSPKPEDRPTAEQLWQHPWMRSGLMRRSVAGWHVSMPELQTDIFAPNVEPEAIRSAYQSETSRRLQLAQTSGGQAQRTVSAFELIKSGLDISALFEARDDVVARHTRFSSRAPLATITAALENAAVAVGGRVTRDHECRLRLFIPNPRGTIQVLAEVAQVVPGTHMVDVQKVKGNTVEFYSWYADLTEVLASIVSKKAPGRAGDVGARAVAARRAADREAGAGKLRANAFQLISSCINLGALFEEEEATSRHVQFSSRKPPAEVLAALEAAAAGLGGSAQRHGERRASLVLPAAGGRSVRVAAHLFEVLLGMHVCQLQREAGSSLDFMRLYAQLAARLQGVMMRRDAFPTATKAAALLQATPSMSEAERRAIEDLPLPSPSDASEAGDAPGGGQGGEGGPWLRRHSRSSLSSVPEEGDRGGHGPTPGPAPASGSSTPAGGSPVPGSSPRAWQPMAALAESTDGGCGDSHAAPDC